MDLCHMVKIVRYQATQEYTLQYRRFWTGWTKLQEVATMPRARKHFLIALEQ